MSKPDLLNLRPEVRKKLLQKPPKDASEQWHQSMIRWAESTLPQKGTANGRSSGGSDTLGSDTNE